MTSDKKKSPVMSNGKLDWNMTPTTNAITHCGIFHSLSSHIRIPLLCRPLVAQSPSFSTQLTLNTRIMLIVMLGLILSGPSQQNSNWNAPKCQTITGCCFMGFIWNWQTVVKLWICVCVCLCRSSGKKREEEETNQSVTSNGKFSRTLVTTSLSAHTHQA